MQSNIFATVAPLLKERKLTYDGEALKEFFKHYRSGEWIYPDAMHRALSLTIQEVYEILEAGVDAKALEQNLEVYCPRCQRFVGKRYKSIFDIPEEVNCVHCDFEIEDPLRHAIVIYKVL